MPEDAGMKVLLSIAAASFLLGNGSAFAAGGASSASAAANDAKAEAVRALVGSYQSLSAEKFGAPIRLTFFQNDAFQATGGMVATGKPEINVYAGLLARLDADSVVSAVCHELGHIFGSVPLRGLVAAPAEILDDSVEGEADYFAGACAVRYFGDADRAVAAIHRTLEAIYEQTISDAALAEAAKQAFGGIDSTYPPAECRLLSSIRGATGSARPKCWYNPAL